MMIRKTAICFAIASALLVTGCGGGGGGGSKPASVGTPGSTEVELNTGDARFFAWQKGSGAWQTEPAAKNVKIPVTDSRERLSVAYVCLGATHQVFVVDIGDASDIPVCASQANGNIVNGKLKIDTFGTSVSPTEVIQINAANASDGSSIILIPGQEIEVPIGNYYVNATTYQMGGLARITPSINISVSTGQTATSTIDLSSAESALISTFYVNNVDGAFTTAATGLVSPHPTQLVYSTVWQTLISSQTQNVNSISVQVPYVDSINGSPTRYKLSFIASSAVVPDSPVITRYLMIDSTKLVPNDVFELPRVRPEPTFKLPDSLSSLMRFEFPIVDDEDEIYGREHAYEMSVINSKTFKSASVFFARSQLSGGVTEISLPDLNGIPGWNSQWNVEISDDLSWSFQRIISKIPSIIPADNNPISIIHYQQSLK